MSSSGFEGLHLYLILHLDEPSDLRSQCNSVFIERRHDGACCMFWGFRARCARDRLRQPSPRLSILMQTRSLSTQRGYISHTKDVLSPDTTHTVSNVLIQSCFVSLSLSLYESWVVPAWNNEEFTHKHTLKHTGGAFSSLRVTVGMMCESKMKFSTSFHVCVHLVQFEDVSVIYAPVNTSHTNNTIYTKS